MNPSKRSVYVVAMTGVLALAAMGLAQAAVDPDIAIEALEDAGVNAGGINVTINDEGVATLSGMVSDGAEGNRALKVLRDVPGITEVNDRMRTDDD